MLFSLFSTFRLAKLNIRKWLSWYLESCAQHGGRIPTDIEPFLPWNLSHETRLDLALASNDSS